VIVVAKIDVIVGGGGSDGVGSVILAFDVNVFILIAVTF
jgi:hypothetical protein